MTFSTGSPAAVPSAPSTFTGTIRHATEADYDAVADLTQRSFLAGPYGHIHASPERVAYERDSAGRAAAGALLVAVDQHGIVVGTASLLRHGSANIRLAGPDEAELRLVATDPRLQGAGVGDALVEASIAEARRWNVSRLVLDTGSLNTGAQRLYLRWGFQRSRERETLDDGQVIPLVYSFDLRRSEGVLIRLVRASEIERVADLTELAYTNDYDLPDGYRRSLRDVADRARQHEVWVAEDIATGSLLATVATPRPGSWISELGRPGELDFRLLAVDPSARGRGLGELLTRHVIELGRERGVQRVVMNSGPEMLGAHRLYDRMGFERLPERYVTFTDSGVTVTLLTFALEL